MIKFLATAVVVASSIFAITPAQAGYCGSGVVTEVKEGGWNADNLLIKIDYSGTPSSHAGTEFQGYIRFNSDLTAERLRNIRALASMALLSGRVVSVFTHNSSCDSATELTVFNV